MLSQHCWLTDISWQSPNCPIEPLLYSDDWCSLESSRCHSNVHLEGQQSAFHHLLFFLILLVCIPFTSTSSQLVVTNATLNHALMYSSHITWECSQTRKSIGLLDPDQQRVWWDLKSPLSVYTVQHNSSQMMETIDTNAIECYVCDVWWGLTKSVSNCQVLGIEI